MTRHYVFLGTALGIAVALLIWLRPIERPAGGAATLRVPPLPLTGSAAPSPPASAGASEPYASRLAAMLAAGNLLGAEERRLRLEAFVRSQSGDELSRSLTELDSVLPFDWQDEFRWLLLGRLAQTNPEEALRVAGQIAESALRRLALQLVAESWADVDAPAAAKWALAQPDAAIQAQIAPALAQLLEGRNPQTAADFVVALASEQARNDLLGALLSRWGQVGLPEALAWAKGLPESPAKDQTLIHLSYRWLESNPQGAVDYALTLGSGSTPLLSVMASQWAGHDPQSAAQWAAQLPAGPQQTSILSSLAAAWAQMVPEEAVRFAVGLPAGSAQSEAVISAVSGWAKHDPPAAMHWAAQFPTGELRDAVLTQVLSAWVQRDAASAAEWLAALPEAPGRDATLSSFSGFVAERHPEIALVFAQTISDKKVRIDRIENVVSRWLTADRDGAVAAIARSDLPPEMISRHLPRG